jgi:hypothetical protein
MDNRTNEATVPPQVATNRGPRAKNQLPPHVANVILSEIADRGRETVSTMILEIDPSRNHNSRASMLRNIERNKGYSFNTTSYALLTRLAGLIRDRRSGKPEAAAAASLQQVGLPIVQRQPATTLFSSPEFIHTLVQQMSAAMVGAMAPLFQQVAAHQSAPALPETSTIGPDGEPPTKDFPDLPSAMQRAVLNSMHGRYADLLKRQGLTDRPFAEAWKQSYAAFYRETGINIDKMASEESDRSGHHVRPLEIIQRSGWLVRFWGICRKAWGDTAE